MHKMEANRIVMLDVQKDGSVVERIPSLGRDSTTDNTLLGAMYPGIQVAIVSVPTEILEDHEEAAVARALTGIHYHGIGLSPASVHALVWKPGRSSPSFDPVPSKDTHALPSTRSVVATCPLKQK